MTNKLRHLFLFLFAVFHLNLLALDYTLEMEDSYGDGWNGASIDVEENTVNIGNYFLFDGFDGIEIVSISEGSNVNLIFNSGDYDSEITWRLYDSFGLLVCSGTSPSIGVICSFTADGTPSFESELPIVIINTNGQGIQDEPPVIADFGIINNTGTNHYSDPFNEYSGEISIEIRGQTSQSFPKKNYKFETVDEFGQDLDTNFLNFPTEEDWILHGPYSDKSLMRNVLAMNMSRRMGNYSSRTHFCEVFIDDNYRGVYVFMEKIKRDKNRIDIAKLNPDEVSGDDLTGGYIFKIDKGGDLGWESDFAVVSDPDKKIKFSYVYPKPELIVPAQEKYIINYVDSFELAINSPDFRYSNKRYDAFIDLESFADNFIVNELSKDVDAYRISSYFFKDKQSKGGLINASTMWDFNLAFGNADYCNGDETNQWMYNIHCDDGNPFWLKNMMKDPIFRGVIRCRWDYYRSTHLHKDSISKFIEDQTMYLGDAIDRNFQRWSILGKYVWPNPAPLANTHQEEINKMFNFIDDRIDWMDSKISNWDPVCDYVSPEGPFVYVDENDASEQFEIYPNPAQSIVNLKLWKGEKHIKIYNVFGELVIDMNTVNDYLKVDISQIVSGNYLLRVVDDRGVSVAKKFTKL